MYSLGRITKIEIQKNNKERASIFVNGQFLLGINAELIYKFDLKKGKELSQDFLEYILNQEEFINAKNAAFRLLSYRQRSCQELIDRLVQKDFDLFIVDQVINVLDRLGYINDREFTNSWIKDRITKSYGPWRIRRELKEKGVGSEIIEDELAKEYDFDLQFKLASEVVQKKRGRYNGETYKKKRYKLSQILKRRGFSFEIINSVLDELLDKEAYNETVGYDRYPY